MQHKEHEVVAFDAPQGDSARLWATIPGYPNWLVRVTVVSTRTGPGISDMRVRPRSATTIAEGAAPRETTPHADSVPAGGVPARLLRAIKAGELLTLAQRCARERSRELQQALKHVPAPLPAPVANLDGVAQPMPDHRDQAARAQPSHMRIHGILPGHVVTATPGDAVQDVAPHLAALAADRSLRGDIDHYLDWAVLYHQKVWEDESRFPIADLARDRLTELGGNYKKAHTWVRDTIQDAGDRYGLLTEAPSRGRVGKKLTEKALQLLAEREQRQTEEES